MISKFTIENFMSIRSSQTISFESTADSFLSDEYTIKVNDGVKLLKVGIIYGSNASGKSNILQAFDFFRQVVCKRPEDKQEETGVVPFLLDDTSRSETTKMSMEFYIGGKKYILSYEMDRQRIYSESLIVYESTRPTKLYKRTFNSHTDSSVVEFSESLKMRKKDQTIISGNTMNNCSVLAAFGYSNVEKTKLNEVYDYFFRQVREALQPNILLSEYAKNYLMKDEDDKLKNFILQLLKASDFNIDDIDVREEEEPVFSHRSGNRSYKLPERYESNGTLRFMGIAVVLHHLLNNHDFFPIDEVESSLHRELLSYFIKVFLVNSKGLSQLLLTTHDTSLLDEDFLRRDIIWFADKDEMGETHIIRLSSLGLHKNVSPYKAYMQDKLVKLPFFNSIFLTSK